MYVLFIYTDHKTRPEHQFFCLELFSAVVLLAFPHHALVNDLPGRPPSTCSSLLQGANNNVLWEICDKESENVKFRFMYSNRPRKMPRKTELSVRFFLAFVFPAVPRHIPSQRSTEAAFQHMQLVQYFKAQIIMFYGKSVIGNPEKA
jgi:hypothetical protein